MSLFGGGPVATALVALSRLGVNTAFCGVTGDDSFADNIKEGLHSEGVNCTGLIRRHSSTSQLAFVLADPKTSQRTILWNRGTVASLRPEEVDLGVVRNSSFLHLDGRHFEAALATAKCAKDNGVRTMLDTGTYRPGIEKLLPYVDYFIVGEGFARHYSNDMKDALKQISRLGPKVVGVTLGKNGSILLTDDNYFCQPAFVVDAVDTTGCGDAFHGGAIYGILNDFAPQEMMRFASAVAALKSRMPGGRKGLPHLTEVNEFLESSPTTHSF